jgi:predicted  nucleic acid-binding Zn-ribbon protein
LEEKMRFCEGIHTKHHKEVDMYVKDADVLDKGKFVDKVKKAVFQLRTDATDISKSKEELEKDFKELKIFTIRARKDLKDEDERYERLKNIMQSQDPDKANEKLRDQIEKMRSAMHKMTIYSIDIAHDPSKAIKQISEPILAL